MVLLEPDVSTTTPAPASNDWFRRVAAVVLDGSVLGGVTWLAAGPSSIVPTLQPPFAGGLISGGVAQQTADWASNPWVLAVLAAFVLLQAFTGATPGKRVLGVAVLRADTGRPAGLWRTLARPFVHVLDAVLLIGYLRPLWNGRRQTFADSILGTVVVPTRRPVLPEWLAARLGEPSGARSGRVTAAASVVCLLGVALSFPVWRSEAAPATASTTCTLEVLDGGDALQPELTYRDVGYRTYERRLWVEREVVTSPPELTLTWTWLPRDSTGETAEQTARLVTSNDPDEVVGIREWGLSPSPQQGRAGVTADQQLGTEDLSGVGEDGWIASTLVVDGESVATCTIDGSDLRG